VQLSTVILPIYRWTNGQQVWQRAEELGFHAAYTYDHLSWRSFRDRPWFGAVPTLTAAALATDHLRLGTLVTSPNFRHPVTLGKDLLTLDDIAGGRLVVGIGSGGTGYDATVLGQEPWSPSQRADRFVQFVALLDRLLTHPATSERQSFYSAVEARMIPATPQQPRPPFLIAATGSRGLALTAEYGQGWVTYGDPRTDADTRAEGLPGVVQAQLAALEAACAQRGRSLDSLDRVLLHSSTAERPLDSLDAFVDWAGRYREIGITELVVHWPVPDSVFANDLAVFEQIATDGLAQLG
jgi:alkanesulfonate monooxygenase SsuD/methylene tetrahydromethanopterin reductase-like flavin-dependent oxidoreductase (luciferase family)